MAAPRGRGRSSLRVHRWPVPRDGTHAMEPPGAPASSLHPPAQTFSCSLCPNSARRASALESPVVLTCVWSHVCRASFVVSVCVTSAPSLDHTLLGNMSSKHLPRKRTDRSLLSVSLFSLLLGLFVFLSLLHLGISGPQTPPLPVPARAPHQHMSQESLLLCWTQGTGGGAPAGTLLGTENKLCLSVRSRQRSPAP